MDSKAQGNKLYSHGKTQDATKAYTWGIMVTIIIIVTIIGSSPATAAAVHQMQFRRDWSLSETTYPEPWAGGPPPGGRLHILVKRTPPPPSAAISSGATMIGDDDVRKWAVWFTGGSTSGGTTSKTTNTTTANFTIPAFDASANPQHLSGGLVDWVRCRVVGGGDGDAEGGDNGGIAVVSLHTTKPQLFAELIQHISVVSMVSHRPKEETQGTKTTTTITTTVSPERVWGTSGVDAAAITSPAKLVITYVASRSTYSELVIHLRSLDGDSTLLVDQLEVNAVAVASGILPAPGLSFSPREHRVLRVPLSNLSSHSSRSNVKQFAEGSVWTVAVRYLSNTSAPQWTANGGRLGKERFFQEAWEHSDMCPLAIPAADGGNATQWEAFSGTMGLDAYMTPNKHHGCTDMHSAADFAEKHGISWMVSHSDAYSANASNIAAVFAGDEVDSSLSNIVPQWQHALRREQTVNQPQVSSYQGSKTNHYVGSFAGITDIQGADFYVAACAPHITPALSPMHLQGALAYLRNARNNQMPLPFWGYTQALCTNCWKTVPSTAEFVIQIASAVAAGSKSLMQFMADGAAIQLPQFAAGAAVIRSVSAVGELLRAGDIGAASEITITSSPTESAASDPEVGAELIAGADDGEFLLVVMSWAAGGYSDLACEIGLDAHWTWRAKTGVAVAAQLSSSYNTSKSISVKEARNGAVVPVSDGVTASVSGGRVVLSGIDLGTGETVARFFVLSVK